MMDLPRREGEQEPPQDASYLGEPVAFGPQAEMCRTLRCIACWALELRRQGMTAATFDWLLLPKAYQTDDYRLRVEARRWVIYSRCTTDGDPPRVLGYGFGRVLHRAPPSRQ